MSTPGLSDSRKTPGIYLQSILGGAGTSGGVAPKRILLVGNRLTLPVGNASPTFTVAAGTMGDATPTVIYSADDAGIYAGRGSELHAMAVGIFAAYPDAAVTILSTAESAGVRASLLCTFAVTASAAFSVRVYACGQTFDVAVSSGDTPTVIATAVATAILQRDTLPFTAQFALGVLTLTAKHPGPRGNTLLCAFSFLASAGTETPITSTLTTSPGATTATLSGGTPVTGEYFFSGGTTQDSIALALAAIVTTRYDRIVIVHIDATNVDLLAAQVTAQAGILSQIEQQVVCGSIATLGVTTGFATLRNHRRLQVVWHYNSRLPIWQVAAIECAARLNGDSLAGGQLTGEVVDPAANLDGLELALVLAQSTVSDQPSAAYVESALNNGITPLVPSANRPGFARVVRSITSCSLVNGVQNYSVLDTSVVTIIDHVTQSLRGGLAIDYAGFKLAPDSADGSPPRAANVVTPRMIRVNIARRLKLFEEQGLLINVDANLALLVVTLNATPGRVDCIIPAACIPGLHLLAGVVRQLS